MGRLPLFVVGVKISFYFCRLLNVQLIGFEGLPWFLITYLKQKLYFY